MNKIWIVLKAETLLEGDFNPSEIETTVARSYSEGIEKFNYVAKALMDSFKENFSKKHNVDNNLSFKEYRKIGALESEFYDFGYSDYLSDGKIFSIRAEKINEEGQTILEEKVILLYSCDFEKETSVQLITLNDDSETVDSFYKNI